MEFCYLITEIYHRNCYNKYLFLAKVLIRTGQTLSETQTHLDKEGASDLVVELVIKSVNSPAIFLEAVQLGIALLEGGNSTIQQSCFVKLQNADLSQSFFKVINNIYYFENVYSFLIHICVRCFMIKCEKLSKK